MSSRITLFLMTYKGWAVLNELLPRYRNQIECVITDVDKNVLNDYCLEIRELCAHHSIPCFMRCDMNPITSAFALSISWRWILRLDNTRLIILHDSLLPRYRGFNPLVSYLINGEDHIGVSALYAAESFDRGEIIAQERSTITYPIKIQQAIEISVSLYIKLAIKIFDAIANGQAIEAQPQDESKASYSLWRDEEDYRITWNTTSNQIKRFIDAVGFPYKGASAMMGDERVRILECEEVQDIAIENRTPGKVFHIHENVPVVVCGKGLLKLIDVRLDSTLETILPLKKIRTRFK
jgi:methionyl-tRNA formyltransferase